MAHQLRHIRTDALFTVAAAPVWSGGMWECGDQRFTDPTGWEYVVVPPSELPTLEPLDFYLAFTVAERRAIKASTAPDVVEFWDTYERCERQSKRIDPNRPSVVEALEGLVALGLVGSSDRIPQILAGLPQ